MAAANSSVDPNFPERDLIPWSDRPGQLSAYNHFRVNHASDSPGWRSSISTSSSCRSSAARSATSCCAGVQPVRGDPAAMAGVRPVGTSSPPRWAGDRELYTPDAGNSRHQPACQVAGAHREAAGHRLHAARRRMQRAALQHARRAGAALRDPADRMPRGHGGEPLLHQVAGGLGGQAWQRGRGDSLQPYQDTSVLRCPARRQSRTSGRCVSFRDCGHCCVPDTERDAMDRSPSAPYSGRGPLSAGVAGVPPVDWRRSVRAVR